MLTLAEQLESSLDFVDWSDPVNRSHPLNRGLVWWFLAIPSRMGWGSFVWRGMVPRYNATLIGITPSTAWQTTPVRRGGLGFLNLANSGTYGTIPDGNYGIANGYTIAATAQGTVSANANIIGRDDSTGERFWQWRFTGAGAVNFIRFDSGNSVVTNITTSGTYNTVPTRILSTFTGAGSATYINGVLDSSDSVTTANRDGTGTIPAIGARSGEQNTNDPFDGVVDDATLWNRGFSAADARADYLSCLRGQRDRMNRIPLPRYAPQDAVVTARPYIIGGGIGSLVCARAE